jgi:hypothetical protein
MRNAGRPYYIDNLATQHVIFNDVAVRRRLSSDERVVVNDMGE